MDWRNVLGIIAFIAILALVAMLIMNPAGLVALLLAIGMLIDPKNAL